MRNKTFLISAADAGYFDLLKGLVLSIHKHRPDDQATIAVLDLGMSSAQIGDLSALGCITAPASWDFDFTGRDQVPRWLQAMTARCHLPRYFPDAQTYIWLDADTWLQDWRAVELLQRAAAGDGVLAIVPELHRAYGSVYARGRSDDHDNKIVFAQYATVYGNALANRMAYLPTINSGVFALAHDSGVWEKWRASLSQGLKSGLHKMSEQNALNAAIYRGEISIHPLPAYCNWICGQALPVFDQANRRFVEPMLPNEPISIMHVTPRRVAQTTISTLQGRTVSMTLDYLALRGSL